MVKKMLEGIKIHTHKKLLDERGSFTELMRFDWKDILSDDKIIQSNFSTSYPGIIRAWHRHLRGQTDYVIVLKGTIKICAFDEKRMELNEIISSEQNSQIVRIPGHYWHGFKVVGDQKAYLLYFTTKLYDYENPDEKRKPWNDISIVAKSINGNKEDSRVGKPWDWIALPNK